MPIIIISIIVLIISLAYLGSIIFFVITDESNILLDNFYNAESSPLIIFGVPVAALIGLHHSLMNILNYTMERANTNHRNNIKAKQQPIKQPNEEKTNDK